MNSPLRSQPMPQPPAQASHFLGCADAVVALGIICPLGIDEIKRTIGERYVRLGNPNGIGQIGAVLPPRR